MSSQDNIESHSVKDGSLLSSSFSDKNESNPVTIPIPDDYEDTSYEEIQADREPDLELSISDTQLNDTTYQTLFHRYNLEEGQVLRLRNQAVFILTVLGFLLTNSIGIIGSDWFKLTTLSSIPFMWYIVLAVMIFFCVLLSVGIIIFIEFVPNNGYWQYPDDSYLEECRDSGCSTLTSIQICKNLAKVILHNERKSDKVQAILNISAGLLFVIFVIIIIFGLILVYTNYVIECATV